MGQARPWSMGEEPRQRVWLGRAKVSPMVLIRLNAGKRQSLEGGREARSGLTPKIGVCITNAHLAVSVSPPFFLLLQTCLLSPPYNPARHKLQDRLVGMNRRFQAFGIVNARLNSLFNPPDQDRVSTRQGATSPDKQCPLRSRNLPCFGLLRKPGQHEYEWRRGFDHPALKQH